MFSYFYCINYYLSIYYIQISIWDIYILLRKENLSLQRRKNILVFQEPIMVVLLLDLWLFVFAWISWSYLFIFSVLNHFSPLYWSHEGKFKWMERLWNFISGLHNSYSLLLNFRTQNPNGLVKNWVGVSLNYTSPLRTVRSSLGNVCTRRSFFFLKMLWIRWSTFLNYYSIGLYQGGKDQIFCQISPKTTSLNYQHIHQILLLILLIYTLSPNLKLKAISEAFQDRSKQ